MIKKPMLSATVHMHNIDKIEFPILASPKLDGIRCLIHPEWGPVTRSFKPIPNTHIRTTLMEIAGDSHLDGELLAVNSDGIVDFNNTQSAVMTRGGQPGFIFMVFDCFRNPELSFKDRFADADVEVIQRDSKYLEIVEHIILKDLEEFQSYADEMCQVTEGVMLRKPNGPYKNGRSTLNQGWLVKYKEWADAEGFVIDFEERMHNANEDIKDNFGYAKRTSHMENMVPMGTLGALVLDTDWGKLRVGTGFDDALRQSIWNRNMVEYVGNDGMGERFIVRGTQPDLGRKVTFKYHAFGMQDKPRFPVFVRFREEE